MTQSERSVCPVCGGRGWHTAGGNDPMACGRCAAGEAFVDAEQSVGESRLRVALERIANSEIPGVSGGPNGPSAQVMEFAAAALGPAPEQLVSVERVLIEDVLPGQTIWAHNDGDWLRVHEVEINSYGDVIVTRCDHSEASFSSRQPVLRRRQDRRS